MPKKRVSLTLDEDLVNRIDRKVSSNDYTNRSQAIERFLKDYLQREKIETAVLLCGGHDSDPECMLKLNGKPLLQHNLEHLETYGIETVILAVGGQHQQIKEHISSNDYDPDIEYITEERPLGTAGGLRRAQDMLDDTFLLLNGDVVCKVDVEDMARTHRRDDVSATMALTTVEDISPYGVVRLKGNRIIGFKEKPSKSEAPSNLINAGVYLLEPRVVEQLPSEDDQQEVNVEEIFDRLADEHDLKGYVYEGEWHDLGK